MSEETTPAEEPVAVIVEAEPDAVAEPANEKPKDKPKAKAASASVATAVVSGGETDPVLLSRCVYMSRVTRKSLSVHHLQRRLAELDYPSAASDPDGWYKDGTKTAVAAFQKDGSLEGDGLMNAATLEAIFDGDPNVTVVID